MTDNVRMQQRLLARVFASSGEAWSTGFRWVAAGVPLGAFFPDRVDKIAPICGSARTSPHNFVFLEGVRAR